MIISIDGLDCSGKETLAKTFGVKVKELLPEKKVVVVSFPDYSSESGKMIKKLLSEAATNPLVRHIPITRKAFILSELFVINRKEFFASHSDIDFEKDIVIFDRYSASNILYQGQGLDTTQLSDLIHFNKILDYEIYKNPYPDYSFFLRVPFDILVDRLQERKASKSGVQDTYEDPAFLRATYHLSEQILAADSIRIELFDTIINQVHYDDNRYRYTLSPEESAKIMIDTLVERGLLVIPTAEPKEDPSIEPVVENEKPSTDDIVVEDAEIIKDEKGEDDKK